MPQSQFIRFLALALLMQASMSFAAKRLSLTIGIDQYDDRYWGGLRFAGKDAEDVTRALEPDLTQGTILTSHRDADQRVTRQDIQTAFAQLSQANSAEDDQIIIYISAHGTVGKMIENGKTSLEKFLVTADTDSQDPQSTGISHKELLDTFEKLKSRRKVLILDTCYSGAGKSKLTKKILEHLAQQKGPIEDDIRNSAIEGSLILSASAWGEEAIESSRYENGLYTYHLIQGFKADLNQDGAISITEAHSYASRKVIEESQGRQHPTAKMEIIGGDPIIVKGRAHAGKPLLFAYDRMMQKLKVELNGTVLHELTKGGATVEPGTHWLAIKDQNDRVLYEKEIHVEPGHEYSLARFLEYDPAYAFAIGPSVLWLNQAQLRRRLGSEPIPGLSLRLRKENFLGSYAIDWQGFTGNHQQRIDSDGVTVRESLRWHEIGAQLGRIWKGSDLRLSGVRKDPDYFIALTAGPRFVWVQRAISDSSYLLPRQSFRAPALAVGAELGWESTDAHLQLSVRLDSKIAQVDAEGAYPRIWSWSSLSPTIGWIF